MTVTSYTELLMQSVRKNKTVVGLTSPQYIIKATNQALLSELNRIDPTNRKLNKSYMYMLNGSCVHTVLQYV